MTGIGAPVFAFGFASPWLLAGLALGAMPVIIHLLHKRRYRETDWAAMRFLLEAARKHSRRIRLEQLILLAVRILILVLLVLALARPYVETLGTFFQGDVPTHRIIVVDASFSMGYQQAEFSRFDRAKGIARQIVSGARQGDALNLVRICDSLPRAIVRQPAYQKSQVIEFTASNWKVSATPSPGGRSLRNIECKWLTLGFACCTSTFHATNANCWGIGSASIR